MSLRQAWFGAAAHRANRTGNRSNRDGWGLSLGIGALGLVSLASMTACSNTDQTETQASPTTPGQSQVVRVMSGEEDCGASPYIVDNGDVTITATGVGDVASSVTLYGPKDGAFIEQLDRITVLAPGATKSMTIPLGLGAYEISCKTDATETRTRITAV